MPATLSAGTTARPPVTRKAGSETAGQRDETLGTRQAGPQASAGLGSTESAYARTATT